jgi:flagellin
MFFGINGINSSNHFVRAKMYENDRSSQTSIDRLNSGHRINYAADDPSGLQIANNLRTQASTLSAKAQNLNDNSGIINIIDVTIGKQNDMLIEMKAKAAQLANEGVHTDRTSDMLVDEIKDIKHLVNSLAKDSSYNGKALLRGSFEGEIQTGLSSTYMNVQSTMTKDIGHVSIKVTDDIKVAGGGISDLEFTVGNEKVKIGQIEIGLNANTGVGRLAEQVNRNSEKLGGIKATFDVRTEGTTAVSAGTLNDFKINGINIGTIEVEDNDKTGVLVSSINEYTHMTGVTAWTNEEGKLALRSDGRGIKIDSADTNHGIAAGDVENYGKIRFVTKDADGVDVVDNGTIDTQANTDSKTFTLDTVFTIDNDDENSTKFGKLEEILLDSIDSAMDTLASIQTEVVGAGTDSMNAAMEMFDQFALKLKDSESQIRDTDFSQESMNFSKSKMLNTASQFAFAHSLQKYDSLMNYLKL